MSTNVMEKASRVQAMDLEDLISMPPKYYTHARPKIDIGFAIHQALEEKELSIRSYAESIGIQHHQLIKVMKAEKNYTIDTLLSILADLDLKIVIQKNN